MVPGDPKRAAFYCQQPPDWQQWKLNTFDNSYQTVSYSSHHIFNDMKGMNTYVSTHNIVYIIYFMVDFSSPNVQCTYAQCHMHA